MAASNFAMLGLGDIVIPGIFIALLLRYDNSLKRGTNFYFNATFIGEAAIVWGGLGLRVVWASLVAGWYKLDRDRMSLDAQINWNLLESFFLIQFLKNFFGGF